MASKQVQFHEDASAEYEAAFDWYYARSEMAASKFAEELSRAIVTIAQAPQRWPGTFGGARKFLLQIFPFAVVYRELPSIIQILAIAHGRRQPGYWKKRLWVYIERWRVHEMLEALEARQRGVYFDPAQGQTHLNFDVADKCFEQNFLPDTISTDLTVVTEERRVYDLPPMVSKFMAMGIGLDRAIGMVTSNAARVFDYGAQIGTLRPGSESDVGIFELRDGKFEFEDSDGGKRTGRQMLVNKAVVRHGQVSVNAV